MRRQTGGLARRVGNMNQLQQHQNFCSLAHPVHHHSQLSGSGQTLQYVFQLVMCMYVSMRQYINVVAASVINALASHYYGPSLIPSISM